MAFWQAFIQEKDNIHRSLLSRVDRTPFPTFEAAAEGVLNEVEPYMDVYIVEAADSKEVFDILLFGKGDASRVRLIRPAVDRRA